MNRYCSRLEWIGRWKKTLKRICTIVRLQHIIKHVNNCIYSNPIEHTHARSNMGYSAINAMNSNRLKWFEAIEKYCWRIYEKKFAAARKKKYGVKLGVVLMRTGRHTVVALTSWHRIGTHSSFTSSQHKLSYSIRIGVHASQTAHFPALVFFIPFASPVHGLRLPLNKLFSTIFLSGAKMNYWNEISSDKCSNDSIKCCEKLKIGQWTSCDFETGTPRHKWREKIYSMGAFQLVCSPVSYDNSDVVKLTLQMNPFCAFILYDYWLLRPWRHGQWHHSFYRSNLVKPTTTTMTTVATIRQNARY